MGKVIDQSFKEVVSLIRGARQRAYKTVNTVLIDLYWQIGEYVSRKVDAQEWGRAVVQQLAEHLAQAEQDLKGFSASNIWRMKQFFEMYKDAQKLATLLRELPWSAHLHIMSKCKSLEEREFYMQVAVKEHWSVRDLSRNIDSCFYERMRLSPAKLSTALQELHPAAGQAFKDTYVFDFLNLPEKHSEKELQRGLIANLKKFLVELGSDFCFVGEEYRLQVGVQDFFVDLLFFHRGLSCLVAFELKVDLFKPDYLGQLSFYLEALDRDVRKPHEKPSVGILLCKSKDSEVVEYALSRTLSPALIAEYHTKLPDKILLQKKMEEFYALESERTIANDTITGS